MNKNLIISLNIILTLIVSFENIFAQFLGNAKYNSKIKDTSNLIAYIYYQQESMGAIRNQEIYFVNAKTSRQYRFTNDQYTDSELCWSPDGNKLLFISHRSKKQIAKYSDSDNFGYLYLYDFMTGKEFCLEKNISKQVDSMASSYKSEGHEVIKRDYYNPNTYSPDWISDNRIAFKRKIYFGDTYGYGEWITADTMGNHIELQRNPFNKREWKISNAQWINEDSIVVSISPLVPQKSKLAIYSVHDNQYHLIENVRNHSGYGVFLSYDKKNLFLIDSNMLIKHNIKSCKNLILNKSMKDIDEFIISPLGDKIAFINAKTDDQNIFIMNLDGSDLKQLTYDGGFKHSLAWSPQNAF